MKHFSRLICILFLIFSVAFTSYAQMIDVTGRLTDETTGKPLRGMVAVMNSIYPCWESPRIAEVSTDKDGRFQLRVRSNDILYVSSGYEYHTATVFVKNRTNIDVMLSPTSRDIAEYESVGPERFGWRKVCRNGKYGFIDKYGREVVPSRYDEVCDNYPERFSLLRVKSDGKYGYVNYAGIEWYPCVYDEAVSEYIVGGDLSRVKRFGRYGFVGIRNYSSCVYENADEYMTYSIDPETLQMDYTRGYARVWDVDEFHFINQDAEPVYGPFEDVIWNTFSDEPLWVKVDGRYFPEGTVSPSEVWRGYDYVSPFQGQQLAVVGEIYRRNTGDLRYGYADKKGIVVIPMMYDKAYPFREGYAAVVKDGKLGFIDQTGSVAVPFNDYEYTESFSEGLAAVRKGGKCGYIDAGGRIVIPFRYEDAYSFRDGSAIVVLGGKAGLIDRKGRNLTQFRYDVVTDESGYIQLHRPDGRIVYLDKYGNEYLSEKELQEGIFRNSLKEAESGSAEACFEVAEAYLHIDRKQYAEWIAKGAERGSLSSQIMMGVWCYEERDYVKAYDYFIEAQKVTLSDYDQPSAEEAWKTRVFRNILNCYLGKMYAFGNGVPQDYQKAVSCLENSLYEDAPLLLAQLAERGLGMEKDLPKAMKLYDRYFRNFGDNYSLQAVNSIKYYLNQEAESKKANGAADAAPSQTEPAPASVPKPVYPEMKKIALVIGNSDYAYGSFLANPVNDAEDIAFKLEELGFDVIQGFDLTGRGILEKVDELANRSSQYDVALFYYAGHGIQHKGVNYLVPVDVNLKSETDLQFDCVPANRVLSRLEEEKCKMKIIILDACRNDPFEKSWNRSLIVRGLAPMDAPVGTFIAFSTAPGSVAKDGTGKNSPYAEALLLVLDESGLNIHDVFQNVHDIVVNETGKEQHPWTSSSLTGRLYLNSK